MLTEPPVKGGLNVRVLR